MKLELPCALVLGLLGLACAARPPAKVAPRVVPVPGPEPLPVSSVLPAGLCGFDRYLGEACAGAPSPRFALVLETDDDTASAEQLLAAGALAELPPGYPFAVTFDDMPARDASRRGLTVVAGLFAERSAAEAYQSHLEAQPSEIVELAEKLEACAPDTEHQTVVQLVQSAPAYLEDQLYDELDDEPHCMVARGRVFVTDRDRLYATARAYAPVRCDDGSEAWVAWEATRLESVVVADRGGATFHQVIAVECDQATVETRRVEADGALSERLSVSPGGPC